MSPAEPGPRVEIAVAVVEHDGRFLIGRRPPGGSLAGMWEFPGGQVGPGETPENAAIRECLEETGLAVRVLASYPAVEHDYAHAAVRIRFFACAPLADDEPRGGRFRWIRGQELSGLEFPPANHGVLEEIARRASANR